MIYYFPRLTGKSFQLPSQLINSISYYTNFLTWETPGTQGGQTENCVELPPEAQNLCEMDHFTQMSSTLPQTVPDSIQKVRRRGVFLGKSRQILSHASRRRHLHRAPQVWGQVGKTENLVWREGDQWEAPTEAWKMNR